jgi:hypothetical protein
MKLTEEEQIIKKREYDKKRNSCQKRKEYRNIK